MVVLIVYVLVFKFFVLLAPYVCYHILSKSENATCHYNYIPDKVSEKGHLISFYNVFQASSKCFVKISSIGLI